MIGMVIIYELETLETNNALLVKIEGPVWYTIYHHPPVLKGVHTHLSINQPTNGNLGHLCLKLWDYTRWAPPDMCLLVYKPL